MDGGRDGHGGDDPRAELRAAARALLVEEAQLVTLERWSSLPARIGYRGPLRGVDGGMVAFRVDLAGQSPATVRELRNDLSGRGLVRHYGTAWSDREAVYGYSCSALDAGLLAVVLADLPPTTRLHLAIGPEDRRVYVVQPAGGAPTVNRPTSTSLP